MANSQITISGTDLTGEQFSVVLTVSNSKWVKTEPNGANQVFITASGVWMRAANIVTLFKNNATTKVAQFTPLIPDKANSGDSGSGNEFETVSTLNWKVDRVSPLEKGSTD